MRGRRAFVAGNHDRVIRQRDLRKTRGGIDQGARPELHACLARSPALDADASGHFDNAGKQAQSGPKAAAWRVLLEFLAADRIAERQRAFARHDRRGANDVDRL